MSLYLDTTGKASLGIGICDRCKRKFPLVELYHDPNAPGLLVCRADVDEFDPWRLPARTPENITLPFVRPDEPLPVPAADVVTGAILLESGGFMLTEAGGYILLG